MSKEFDDSGCYGSNVNMADLKMFLEHAFAADDVDAINNKTERFATCVWGPAGCVLPDTEIEVRKVGSDCPHNFIVVNPIPA